MIKLVSRINASTLNVGCIKLSTAASKKVETVGEVTIEKFQGVEKGIAVYSLNRPKVRNALGNDLVLSIKEANEIIRNDDSLSVVIIRSTLKGIFCAGADLKERFKMNHDQSKLFVHGLRKTLTEIEDFPMPTIAAIDGTAVGGGLELALACDLRVGSSNAMMGLVETSRGLLPGAGGTQRLPRVIPLNLAKELIYTSRIINGITAKEYGILNHVVEQNENGDAAYLRAMELAKEIIPNAPIAIRMAKKAVNEGIQGTIKEGYNVEQRCYEVIVPTKDRQEGMISFFEKRKPVYKGE